MKCSSFNYVKYKNIKIINISVSKNEKTNIDEYFQSAATGMK
jgi:hypothetical protein